MVENILKKIKSPDDLKELSIEQLKQVCCELREMIITTVAKTGGHLAPSLGVVELTTALHYVFDTPDDKIVWDVGHQAYAHKLLTGRQNIFSTLRQKNGISGFPRREESPYDVFNTGHSSTSISVALGIAKARDLSDEDFKVLAVIGDAAISSGMAFEALNHAGHSRTDITVILNDNEMSISKNVGALSSYLNRIMTKPLYNRMRKDIELILKKIPKMGPTMVEGVKKIEESLKNLMVPGILFEELGFRYFGPIDGHNLDDLIDTMNNIRDFKTPRLIHVITKKGKGYAPAENNPSLFHGVGPFEIETGKQIKKSEPPSYTKIFSDTMVKIGEQDDQVVAITAAMPAGTGLSAFAEKFPERFFDVGIAEQHAVTFSAGLSLLGKKPVCTIYSSFMQRAFDQIIHDVCLTSLPVVFALDRAGLVGEDGATHQGVFDLSFLRLIPNITILAPKDENEFQHLLFSAINHQAGPVAIRYPRGRGMDTRLDDEFKKMPFTSEIVKEGAEVLIIAIGAMVDSALKVAAEIDQDLKIKTKVINLRCLKPLDTSILLPAIEAAKHVITIEENALKGGMGSAILEFMSEEALLRPTLTIGIPDKFIEHGHFSLLFKDCGLDIPSLVKNITNFIKR